MKTNSTLTHPLLHLVTCLMAILCISSTQLFAAPNPTGSGVDSYYLIIDTSTSMNEVPKPPAVPAAWTSSKLEEVKKQLAEFCEHLPTEASVNIFMFDEGPPRRGPQFNTVGKSEREALRKFFAELKAEGEKTYAWRTLDHILALACNEIKSSDRVAGIRILMFTDGEDNDPHRPKLEGILSRHGDLLKDPRTPIQVNYLTLGFTISSGMRDLFASYGVEAIPSLRPEELTPLVPNFSWVPEHPTIGDDVRFIDHSSGTITSTSWHFSDGTSSKDKAPVHRFGIPGEHRVRQTITGIRGRSQSLERVIMIAPTPKVEPRFEVFPSEVKVGQQVLFRNTTAGNASSFSWKFGDETHSTDREPTHRYAKPGLYTVTLKAGNAKGKETLWTITNAVRVVGPAAPTANFVALARVEVKQPVHVLDRSSGPVTEWHWNFGDGTPVISGRDVQHRFQKLGKYSIELTCVGPGGTNTFVREIEVTPPAAPVASFVIGTARVVAGEPVRLVSQSIGAIDRMEWRFSDSEVPIISLASTNDFTRSTTISHVFVVPGEHSVSLITTGPGGRSETTESIVVLPPPTPPDAPPVARMEVTEFTGTAPLKVVFRNQSEGTIHRYTLDFGDGSEPWAGENFVDCTHIYEMPGTYTPTLRAEGTSQFAPSTFTSAQSIVVKTPPPWWSRHLWLLCTGIVGIVGIAAYARPVIDQRIWESRNSKLSGTIQWKPINNKKPTVWSKPLPISSDNLDSTLELLVGEGAEKKSLILNLRKRLNSQKRTTAYSAGLQRGNTLLDVAAIEPSSEKTLPIAGIILRYDP